MKNVTFAKVPFYNVLGMRYYKLLSYPLNLCYLSAALEKDGFNTNLVDGEIIDFKRPVGQKLLNVTPFKGLQARYYELIMNHYRENLKEVMTNPRHHVWDRMIEEIRGKNPDLVGITCYTVGMNGVKILSQRIKEDLGIPIVLGGPHTTAMAEETMEYIPDADYIVVGEGEETLVELAKALDSGKTSAKDLEKIDGLVFRNGKKVVTNQRRQLIQDLDKIPFPNLGMIDQSKYYGDVICTSRGCPFQCVFCASNVMWGRTTRFRSVDNIIEELKQLKDKHKSHFIRIVDDTFTLRKGRIAEFCEKVKENGLDTIKFSLGSRVDTLDEEMLKKLKDININTITFGIETGSPRVQELIKKGITNEKVIKALDIMNKNNVDSHVFFMVGHPTETPEDIQMSKDLCLRAKPTSIEVNIVSPYPRTGLWDMTFGNKRQVENWYEWYHQGKAKCGTGAMTADQVSKEYKKFVWFTKIYSFKRKFGLIR